MPDHASRRFRCLRVGALALAVGLLTLLPVPQASVRAQDPASAYTTQLVLLGPHHDVIAGLYQPTSPTSNASTAIFVMHETANFIDSTPCLQLAQRGFTLLCAKSQFTEQAQVDWDQIALDVGYGISYLRSLPGIKHVVLLGWSGGGAIMPYYQNVAEHGVAVCQAPQRLDPCSSQLAGLPPADGVIMLDAIPGLAFARLANLDGAAVRPDGLSAQENPSLDIYNPRNGYNPSGSSDYSTAFIDRYTQAQAQREAALVRAAQKLHQQIASGHAAFSDDMPFPVGRDSANIWENDLSLLSHTKGEYPLITPSAPNGTAPQVIHSVRVIGGVNANTAAGNDSWDSAGASFTVNTFLSTFDISAPAYRLTADSIDGVDWASSNTATVSNVHGITVPLLIMSMTGHYWIVPSEMYYQAATGTTDKTLAFVWGASHGFTPCTACETSPGEFGDTVAETFNYIANWLNARF